MTSLECTRKSDALAKKAEKRQLKEIENQKAIEVLRMASRGVFQEPHHGEPSTEVGNNNNLGRHFELAPLPAPLIPTAQDIDLNAPLADVKKQVTALPPCELKQLIYGELKMKNGRVSGGWKWKVDGRNRPIQEHIDFAMQSIANSRETGDDSRNQTTGGGSGSDVPEASEFLDDDDTEDEMDIAKAEQEVQDKPEVEDTRASTALQTADGAAAPKKKKQRGTLNAGAKKHTKSGRPIAPAPKFGDN